MKTDRRKFLKGAGATIGGLALAPSVMRHASAQANVIKVAGIHDLSGGLDIYGRPMVDCLTFAVEEINAAGGLLGKQLKLISYDAQSNIQLYTQFATEAATKERVAVVHAGITSASREAIRPVLKRFNTLYFYNTQYEGGVCDRNCFCTGSTPAQNVDKLVPYGLKKFGKKIYTVAADYNYGQITAKWLQYYIEQRKGQALKTEFFPLDVSDFGSTIAKIQQEKPTWVVSALVGGAHMSFYRQWAASGMNKKIPLASTTFGVGNEHLALSPAEGDGILIAGNYSQESPLPANKQFLAKFGKRFGDTKIVHEIAISQYQGIMVWAACVKKAGSLDRAAMLKAIESGVSIDGPAGKVTIEPKTHHAALDINVMEVKNQKLAILETVKQRAPSDTARYCDLQKNPDENKQFEVKI